MKGLRVVLYVKTCLDKHRISHLHRKCNVVYTHMATVKFIFNIIFEPLRASVVVEVRFIVRVNKEGKLCSNFHNIEILLVASMSISRT